ncbi:MAG: two-component regulator propeller domain-containing protein [Bryobacteraceae bacterium]
MPTSPDSAARAAVALAAMALAAPCALALNPALDVSQYAHTAWKVREGFTKGAVNAIAQTPDGYLWLGTDLGLVRFDGVRTVDWHAPPEQSLPTIQVTKLLAGRDGTLWIGTPKGLASWKAGKLTRYTELAGLAIYALLESREGTIWVGAAAFPPPGKLCAIRNGGVHCRGEDGSLGNGVSALYEDRKGALWVGVSNGLWRWIPGPPKFYAIQGLLNGIQGLLEGDDGAILFTMLGTLGRFDSGKTERLYTFPGDAARSYAHRLLRDRDGGLWIATASRGLVHIHHGRTDAYTVADGLSGDDVAALFEDREGNIWAATPGGLDRFRDFAAATYSVDQGLSNALVTSVVAARGGSVWLGTFDGLNRFDHGQWTVYRARSAHPSAGAREAVGPGWPERGVQCLFLDDRGRLWIFTLNGAGYWEDGRYVPVLGLSGTNYHAIAEDRSGNVWAANSEAGLFRVSGGRVAEQISWASLGHPDGVMALAADPRQGGLWLGFHRGGLAYFSDGQIRAQYTAADGLGEGPVSHLRFDADGALWASTDGGLSRWKNGRFRTLGSRNGLPCDAVHWSIQDDDHSLWLYTVCGLARVARSDIDAWAAAVDSGNASPTVRAAIFDNSDGVSTQAAVGFYSPHVARSPDGRLWFKTFGGVSVIDPRHLPFNRLPPPVHIEQIVADRKTCWRNSSGDPPSNSLPPLVRDVEIDYTALSLTAPEKVRFRYKLEGRDRDWTDAGTRRQAFYADLPPRHYRFRAIACNNSGVWNEAGAALDFSVAPALYQTAWFQLSCVAASLGLLAVLYRLRLLYLAREFNIRLEERVGERTRIARDLHDTLLQSFQGVLLKFHAVSYQLPDRPEAKKALEAAIEQARQAIAEGRKAVQGLRASNVVTNDLARAVTTFGYAIVADHAGSDCPDFRVAVEGASRDLAPLVRDEIYRVACEALRNAFRHAGARRIEVDLHYGKRQFRLRVRDDGKGIDPQVLRDCGRLGHHGLPGMYERAKLVGGKLAIWSEIDSGAEIELTVSAAVAYEKSPPGRQPASSESGA